MTRSFFLPLLLSLSFLVSGTDTITSKTIYLVRHAETCLELERDPIHAATG